jgi:hypothetical protein
MNKAILIEPMNRVRGSAPIKENLPYFCHIKLMPNAKQTKIIQQPD